MKGERQDVAGRRRTSATGLRPRKARRARTPRQNPTMRNLFPVFLFLGLVVGGVLLQREAGARRKALENSLGGARVGISLEMCAAFQRQTLGPEFLTGPFAAAANKEEEEPFGVRSGGLFGETLGATETNSEWDRAEASAGLALDGGLSEASLLGQRP